MTITLTLKVNGFSVTDWSETDLARLSEILSRDEWSDGRYPFSVEMAHLGIAQMFKSAIGQLTWEKAVTLHPTNSDADVIARQRYCEAPEQQHVVDVRCDFSISVSAEKEPS